LKIRAQSRHRLCGKLVVLRTRTVIDRHGVTIRDIACRDAAARGHMPEHASAHMLVFVRRGCFVRTTGGEETVFDPTVAYCANPGDEERFDHPHPGGDDCTAVCLDPSLAASLWGNDAKLPSGPLLTPPRLDLEQRLLVSAARRGADPDELLERAITLAAATLELTDHSRVAAGRPTTARARARVVRHAREALAAEPNQSLQDLAGAVAVSPHHLSRIFHRVTGRTISRHRLRLRTRAALERLADGERNLARLAADTGFADQSHLCRTLHAETGTAPSALRELLGEPREDT
jgi:AraC-like DNA-binding protein